MPPLADKTAHTVTLGKWRGFSFFNLGLVSLQYLQFCLFICPIRRKWASSEKLRNLLVAEGCYGIPNRARTTFAVAARRNYQFKS